jgi:hypothetical protein
MNYLIYKISGGLCHMLLEINRAIHLSKISNRFLIIDCKGNAFDNDFNKYFNIPGFKYSTNYDVLYADKTVNKNLYEPYINVCALSVESTYVLNDKLISINAKEALLNNERIIFCSAISHMMGGIPWYIKVNADIVEKISVNKINKKYIGIHYRNTDMKHDLESFIPKIKQLSSECKTIYLGTDDYTAYDRLKALLEDEYEIIQYTKPYNNKGYSIHYGNPDKDEVIMTALMDLYHLTYSTYFIPSSKSGYSIKVEELRRDDNFFNTYTENNTAHLKEILTNLVVYNPVNKKIRLGILSDGGYIIIDDYDYDFFITGGTGGEISFELDFIKKYPNIKGIAFDGKFDDSKLFPEQMQFIKKYIGNINNDTITNLREYVQNYKNIFMKIDIEGGEWKVIPALSELLVNIKQLIFEAHHFFGIFSQNALESLQLLNKTHYLVHAHENNNSMPTKIENIMYPSLLELTYIRKKDCLANGFNIIDLPIKDLDYPNIDSKEEHNMNMWPFNFKK